MEIRFIKQSFRLEDIRARKGAFETTRAATALSRCEPALKVNYWDFSSDVPPRPSRHSTFKCFPHPKAHPVS
jgi:hypothetical protein